MSCSNIRHRLFRVAVKIRRTTSHIIFRGVALLALLIAGITFSWDDSYKVANEYSTQDPKGERIDPEEKRLADYTLWLMIFTGVLGTVSIIQIYFLIRSDKIARQSAIAAKRAANSTSEAVAQARTGAIAELRAYIFVEKVIITVPDSGRVYLNVTLKNFGKTPCYRGVSKLESELRQSEPDDNFIFNLSESAAINYGLTIPPDGNSTARMDVTEYIADHAAWTALRGQGKRVYAWGRIDYENVFGKSNWMTFQMFHDFYKPDIFSICKYGNNSD